MKTLYAFCFILISSFAYSQCENDWIWADSDHGWERNELHGVQLDNNGNTYIAGWFDSDSIIVGGITIYNFVQGESGNGDMYVAKLDQQGNGIWAHAVGGNNSDWCWAMAIDAEGNVAIAGEYYSPTIIIGTTTLTNGGLSDIFIAKYSSAGDFLWARDAGTGGSDSATGVTFDDNGNLYATGQFDGNAFFGIWPLAAQGGDDIFVVKYDVDGDVEWAHSYGGADSENGIDLATTPENDLLMAARSYSPTFSFASDTYNNQGMSDILMMKISSDGNPLWMKSYGGNSNDQPGGIDTDANGNIFIAGDFWSPSVNFDGTVLTPTGQNDMFLVKTDEAGDALWVRKAGGNETDRSQDCVVDNDGNVLFCGHVGSAGANFSGLLYSTHGFFMSKYSSDGDPLWVIGDGGDILSFASWDEAFGIDINNSDAISVGGNFLSNELEFGDITIPHTADFGMVQSFYAHYAEPDTPLITLTGTNEICEGDTILITAEVTGGSGNILQWYFEGELVGDVNTSTLQDFNADPSQTGSYILEVIHDCGTEISEIFEIIVEDIPAVPQLEFDSLCAGNAIVLPATANGIWSGPGVNGNVFDPWAFSLEGMIVLEYNYQSDLGCTASGNDSVFVSQPMIAGGDNELIVCVSSEELLLENFLVFGSPGGTWFDSNMNEIDPTLDPSDLGIGTHEYVYVVNMNSACPLDEAQFQITVVDDPDAGSDAQETVCIDLLEFQLATLLDPDADEGGAWFDGNFDETLSLIDLIELGAGTFEFYYIVQMNFFCTPDTAMIELTIDMCDHISDTKLGYLAIYPNPATDILNIRFRENALLPALHIYDSMGKNVPVKFTAADNTILVDVSGIEPGAYFIRIISSGVEENLRLIITN